MYENYEIYLCKVLKLFSKTKITEADVLQIQPPPELNLCKLKKVKPHTEILTMGFDTDLVCITLTGECLCIIYSFLGNSMIADNLVSPHILGLLESILGMPKYTASIKTSSTSYVLELPRTIFEHAMHNNLTVANACISYYANIATYYMDMAEIRALYHTDDTILLYLFNCCHEKPFPHQVTISRRAMSDLLHINLRSLYRYLNLLQEENFLSIIKGKITITKEQYEKLKQHCTEVIGDEARSLHVVPDSFFYDLK